MLGTFLHEAAQGGTPLSISFADDAKLPATVAIWRLDGGPASHLLLSKNITTKELIDFVSGRLQLIWPLLATYLKQGTRRQGQVNLNLGDHTARPGISFCARDTTGFLIADPIFIGSRGYAEIREHFSAGGLPWAERAPIALWRGATTGGRDRRNLPRIHLCALAAAHPHMLDAGITKIVQLPPAVEADIRQAGYLRDYLEPHLFDRYRYQIDIDGNTNSWPGLFQKLLTGSVVLKITSAGGWRQWYYDRLVPWVNFVPVEADMRDLLEKIEWLRNHDTEAAAIGSAGRMLALSMTYESETEASLPVIAAAIAAGNV